jgi:hypothetical protein
MSQDLRLALRLLWRDRTFSLTAGLTLALCIGANTALFAVVQHVLLRPLPFLEPQQILLMAKPIQARAWMMSARTPACPTTTIACAS